MTLTQCNSNKSLTLEFKWVSFEKRNNVDEFIKIPTKCFHNLQICSIYRKNPQSVRFLRPKFICQSNNLFTPLQNGLMFKVTPNNFMVVCAHGIKTQVICTRSKENASIFWATLKPGNRNPESWIRNLEFEIWNLEFGIWNLEFGIWNLEFGIWNLEFGIWNLEFGIWNLEFGIRN